MKGEEKRDKRERKYHCDLCNFHSNDKAKIGIHFSTLKHTKREKEEKEDEKRKKIYNSKYQCKLCDFYSNDKAKYNRHIGTKKHKEVIKTEEWKTESSTSETAIQRVCTEEAELQKVITILKDVLPHLAINNITNNNRQITNNNQRISNNQINIFLNEKCANAMSIQDFAKQLSFAIDDLLMKKQDALVSVINRNLNPLKETERPVHCTNVARRKWHVKDEIEGWQKDDGSKLIKTVNNSMVRKGPSQYSEMHPDLKTNRNSQEEYIKIVQMTSKDIEPKAEGRVLTLVGEKNQPDI